MKPPQLRGESHELLRPLADILGVLLDVDPPWRQAAPMVKETAERYKADISTLFEVQGDQLWLKGGVLLKGGVPQRLPLKAYELNWGAKSWHDLTHKGITAGVAVLNKPVAYDSVEDLLRNPAHRGLWDDIYGDIR